MAWRALSSLPETRGGPRNHKIEPPQQDCGQAVGLLRRAWDPQRGLGRATLRETLRQIRSLAGSVAKPILRFDFASSPTFDSHPAKEKRHN